MLVALVVGMAMVVVLLTLIADTLNTIRKLLTTVAGHVVAASAAADRAALNDYFRPVIAGRGYGKVVAARRANARPYDYEQETP